MATPEAEFRALQTIWQELPKISATLERIADALERANTLTQDETEKIADLVALCDRQDETGG